MAKFLFWNFAPFKGNHYDKIAPVLAENHCKSANFPLVLVNEGLRSSKRLQAKWYDHHVLNLYLGTLECSECLEMLHGVIFMCLQYTLKTLHFYSKNKVVRGSPISCCLKLFAGFRHFWVPKSGFLAQKGEKLLFSAGFFMTTNFWGAIWQP